jgi:hypothetical protein
MSGQIISLKTRKEFREWMTEWVLRQIDEEFQNAGLHVKPGYEPEIGGQRRALVEQYYAAIDFTCWEDVRRLLTVYETVLDRAERLPEQYAKLLKLLERDGFTVENHRIVPKGGRLALAGIGALADVCDAGYIRTQLARIEGSVDADPSLAIGSAKELIETCCKTVLTERSIPVDANWDLPQLVKATIKELKLTPEDIPEPKQDSPSARKAVDAMKVMLMNLAAIAGKMAELRNAVGTGHGPDGKTRGPKPRHARLAVNATAALVMFLFETHLARIQEATAPDKEAK